ncbi:PREDICTED: ribosomal protein S6 kinase delta-1 isoform X1 [Nanorana parkeri]|uniref:ribosomal protein S6 kinase delta-1 isoform X1 n=2 Tax=Nanorana parkeri TaxID=125878 RepID=UPI0008545CB1|nr:PREDICTED: ribosomal protein S6 kinase delta-1 isoform X1 [Nanorana parkeri]
MISPRDKGDLARFYTVTDPRRHQKGFTIYKVTARIVSRKNPEEVQEIVSWKRYSDFKKLHRDLWQIHKNLFRQTELFPPFAKAKLFGRFDTFVIEERRQCAEDLLQFSANIPALYNSSQLEEFFRGGEVHDGSDLIGPAEPFTDYPDSLSDCSSEVRKDSCGLDDLTVTSQSECGGLSSDSDLISLTVDIDSLSGTDDGMASNQISPSKTFSVPPSPGSLAQSFSASSYDGVKAEVEKEGRSLFTTKLKQKLGRSDYLMKAGELITLAMKKEAEQDYESAFGFYRKGVDLLLEGVQGEASPTRREAVKKKTAEYLMRAETISSLCLKPTLEEKLSGPPGAESSRPSWNLRSPAEELKAFRVLGVIDKVLLVLDTRTQETFILKGLRKSSEESGSRKTIIPRCVPNMVCLRKYIISEESVYLVLQHAEGGKLWSYLSKFLSRSTEGSFDVPLAKSSNSNEDFLKNLAPCPRNSIESRESGGGNRLSVQPLHSSLTLSSQDDSSTQDDEGRESPLKWADSPSSSEEECTTSYLTLCKEYGQEKMEPETLSDDPLIKLGGVDSAKDLDILQNPLLNKFDSQLTFDELKLLQDVEEETMGQTSLSDALSKSRNSPMEFFRIDSKESASDMLGGDFVDKAYSLKPEIFNSLSPFQDDDVDSETQSIDVDKPSVRPQDTISRSSNDSVPVISFKDAAVDDVSSIDEGRPDLLVNLPGTQLVDTVESLNNLCSEKDVMDSKLLETPDVLQIKSSLDQIIKPQENLLVEDVSSKEPSQDITLCPVSVDNIKGSVLTANPEGSDLPLSLNFFEHVSVQPSSSATSSSLLDLTNKQFLETSTPNLHSATSSISNELTANLLQLQIKIEDTDKVSDRRRESREEQEIHKIFQELDAKLSEAAHLIIPESCIRRWAAEIVVALDALHREGIVCCDLNPNNILLNDRGHIQLTYFSRWMEVEDSCDSEAMERMYCAPEVGSIAEETEACDWWSLGALLFELLTRKALVDCHPAGIGTHTSLNMPECVSKEARSLIQQLLQFNPMERLGAGVAGVEEIKSHPFFTEVDWEEFTR